MHAKSRRIGTSDGPRELLIGGTGGFARETAEAVRALNAEGDRRWRLLGFLDDNPALHGETVAGLPVLGPIESIHARPEASLVVATGRPDNYVSRRQIVDRLGLDDERYATIIHPQASMGSTCKVGAGSVLLAHADLTADVQVGRHVAMMPQVLVPHDAVVEDFATLAGGVRLGGSCRVGVGAYLGSGACLRQDLTVGDWAMVGMGAIVTRDVPSERLWQGVPARDKGWAPLPHRRPSSGLEPTPDPGTKPSLARR